MISTGRGGKTGKRDQIRKRKEDVRINFVKHRRNHSAEREPGEALNAEGGVSKGKVWERRWIKKKVVCSTSKPFLAG